MWQISLVALIPIENSTSDQTVSVVHYVFDQICYNQQPRHKLWRNTGGINQESLRL